MASNIRYNLGIVTEKGFTLVEMVIAMAIFTVIMLITSNAFNKLLAMSGSLTKSAESNIEGVVGLQMLRKDIAQAGYGLPWTVQSPYLSADSMPITLPVGDDYKTLNDDQISPPNPPRAPRAIWSLDNTGYNGSDYLAIKSTVAAMNKVTKKTAISRAEGVTSSDPLLQFAPDDTASVIKTTYDQYGNLTDKLLIVKGTYKNMSTSMRPKDANDTYVVYGIDDQYSRAPFNRADYFIYRPTSNKSVPDVCAKINDVSRQSTAGIGILYKAVMNQRNGSFTLYPILDCVLDMQVVYGLDTNGYIGHYTSDLSTLTSHPEDYAFEVRKQVREVRVYVLAQEGKIDPSYTYPKSSVYIGEFNKGGRLFDFTMANIRNWQNYHWKIYTIVVNTQ